MDMKVVIDASVWVGRFIDWDVNHTASGLWMERLTFRGGLLVAPSFLLIEVAAAISRLTKDGGLSKQSVEELTSTKTMKLMALDARLVQASVNVATTLQLRAGDAIYVAVAHQLNIPLVTWDKEQLQRASSIITTYTPSNFPI